MSSHGAQTWTTTIGAGGTRVSTGGKVRGSGGTGGKTSGAGGAGGLTYSQLYYNLDPESLWSADWYAQYLAARESAIEDLASRARS